MKSFFWHKGANEKGILTVAWNCITNRKIKGGLDIKNLTLANHSVMAKNVFKYLNTDDAI